MPRKRIGEILVQAGVLSNEGLRTALVEQRRWGGPIGRILIDMNLITEEALVDALSAQLNFPKVNLDGIEIPEAVIALVSGELAAHHRMMPFKRESKFLDVAMSEPTDLGIIDELRIRTQLNVRPYLAGPKMIERAITRYYGEVLFDDPEPTPTPTPAVKGPITGRHKALSPEAVPSAQRAGPRGQSGPVTMHSRDQEIRALQDRISQLEALVSRDEDVLRKVLGLLVDKGIATREEILERLG
jgi:Type II secretion system (T2SS), protein E, N-terminal domain